MEVYGEGDIYVQPMEDLTLEQDLWPCGEKPMLEQVSWQDCDPVRDPCWSSTFLKDCTPWEGPTLEQFVKNCSRWEGPMLEKFVEDCLLGVRPHAGAGEECEGTGAAETMCNKLTITPIPGHGNQDRFLLTGKKRQTPHPSTRRGRRIQVTTASQLSPWECYGANPPGRHCETHEGQKSDWKQPRAEGDCLGSSFAGKNLSILVDSKRNMSQQCVLVVKMANKVLSCISRILVKRSSKVVLPLYMALVKLNMEYCVQCPQYKRD
ncbi:hypothetical protein QYF61_000867 [Mycteria americana]|uniref:Uncharacterized protein n=1 Tax=Mycteria americana TaxID=33587 RepID=A0AAN7NMQ6_MYCAM|nr:hypothetical protein QYF61_000867 [Mycteria americana]